MNKLLIGTTAVLAITLISILNVNPPTSAEFDELAIQQELQHQGQVLDNHEGRITNVEEDVKTVQEATGTPISTQRVEVREVEAQPEQAEAEPEPEAQPVVVSYSTRESGNDTYCDLTYSDGSKESNLWQKKTPSQGVTGGEQYVTIQYGACNSSLVGTANSS